MIPLSTVIESVGLIGPGFASWVDAQAILAGHVPYEAARTVVPAPASLPSAERRRTGTGVKLALAVGHEAVTASGRDAASLATVFAASGGDGQNCHAICETLASDDRKLSPTRFHNSVHNAPAGYWSIATRAMAPSNVLCAYDGSFAAGLLESLCQVAVDGVPTLLIAFDTEYPAPMRDVRPVPDAFGVALLLSPLQGADVHTVTGTGANVLARIDARLTDTPATVLAVQDFEQMRRSNPAARALPLLEALAKQHPASVVLDYLQDVQLQLDITVSNSSSKEAAP
jgi:Beta-ketoacyl synthase, N-terminal domain